MPGSWIGLTTASTFPIPHNTTLAVSCQEGYTNSGSDVITCNTFLYGDYSYTTEPNCKIEGTVPQSIVKSISIIIISCRNWDVFLFLQLMIFDIGFADMTLLRIYPV